MATPNYQELYQNALAALQALGAALTPPAAETPPPVTQQQPTIPVTPSPVVAGDSLGTYQEVGTIGASQLYLFEYNGGFVLGQIVSASPKEVVFRGDNILDNPLVRLRVQIDRSKLKAGNSGNGGMDQPANMPTPDGYELMRYEGDRREYFLKVNAPAGSTPAVNNATTTPVPSLPMKDDYPETN